MRADTQKITELAKQLHKAVSKRRCSGAGLVA